MKKEGNFVLDCSVTMSWCFPEEATKQTIAIRNSLACSIAYVPSIWPLEVNNILWLALKKQRISEMQTARFKYLLKSLPIQIDLKASDLYNEVIFDLSKRYQLTSYDAAYLELALREQLPLATLDKDLMKAAHSAKIHVLI